VPVEGVPEGTAVALVVRFYDLKFWREDAGGIATVVRTTTLGDRVKVEAAVDGAGPIFSQFPRRSSLLRGIEPGCRIHIQVTLARVFPRGAAARGEPVLARAA
jgi:sulfate transport system ATP-binding protein